MLKKFKFEFANSWLYKYGHKSGVNAALKNCAVWVHTRDTDTKSRLTAA